MDPREISFDEQEMEYLLSGLQNLLLGAPGPPMAPGLAGAPMAPGLAGAPVAPGILGVPVATGILGAPGALDVAAALEPRRPVQAFYQQYTENIAVASEFNIIDVEVVAAELNYAIEQMSWRYNLREEDFCPFPFDYFNIITIMEYKHYNNHVLSQEAMVRLWSRSGRTMTMPPDTRTSSLEVLLKCTSCSVIIFKLYESFNRGLYNSNRPVRMIGGQILNEANLSQTSESCINTQRPTRPVATHFDALPSIRPSSPLPSTSNLNFFDQPSSADGMIMTSPILNLPSTSTLRRSPVGGHQLSVESKNKKLSVDSENRVESKNSVEKRKKIVKRKNEKRNQRNMRK